jgi:hypothetical protein
MVAKNRYRIGNLHPNARLHERDIPRIRARHAAGETFTGLARDFGMSVYAVFAVVKRKTWKHVP